MEWKDVTRYSQSCKEKKPSSWEIDIDGMKVYITLTHIYHPGQWVMHCRDLELREIELNVGTEEEAKEKAIKIVYEKIKSTISELNKALSLLENGE